MFNKTGITKTTYGNVNQILANVELQQSFGIVVSNADYVTVGGRKIVKAGTPLYGDLNARTTAFVKETTTAAVTGNLVVPSGGATVVLPAPAKSNAVGVLLNDVDVTDGNANGTLLLFGFVNKSRLDSDVQALITAPVQAALNKITFLTA